MADKSDAGCTLVRVSEKGSLLKRLDDTRSHDEKRDKRVLGLGLNQRRRINTNTDERIKRASGGRRCGGRIRQRRRKKEDCGKKVREETPVVVVRRLKDRRRVDVSGWWLWVVQQHCSRHSTRQLALRWGGPGGEGRGGLGMGDSLLLHPNVAAGNRSVGRTGTIRWVNRNPRILKPRTRYSAGCAGPGLRKRRQRHGSIEGPSLQFTATAAPHTASPLLTTRRRCLGR